MKNKVDLSIYNQNQKYAFKKLILIIKEFTNLTASCSFKNFSFFLQGTLDLYNWIFYTWYLPILNNYANI